MTFENVSEIISKRCKIATYTKSINQELKYTCDIFFRDPVMMFQMSNLKILIS